MQNKLFKLASSLYPGYYYNDIIKLATNNEAKFARKINIDFIAHKLNTSDGKAISTAIDNDEGFFTLEQINQIAAFPLTKWTKPDFDPKTALSVDVRALLIISNVLGVTTSSLIDDYICGSKLNGSKIIEEMKSFGLVINWTDINFYYDGIEILNVLQKKWHDNLASKQKESNLNTLLNYNVIWSYNGYDIIYVPSNDEMECYPGLPGTSYDRIVLGNKLGICIGSASKYYQDNSEGKIYTLCLSGTKEPVVSIRMDDDTLYEARMKGNQDCLFKYAEIIMFWIITHDNDIMLNSDDCGIRLDDLIYSTNKIVSNYLLANCEEIEYINYAKKQLAINSNWLNETRDKKVVIINDDGDDLWYLNGLLHRQNGPAVEKTNGDKEWWINGKLHREDGPAIEVSNGDKHWYLNGYLHRNNSPAIEYANGAYQWYHNGLRHREDGPAVKLTDGSRIWWLNGKLHRIDGPAVEQTNGKREWWVDGKKYTEADFNKYIKTI